MSFVSATFVLATGVPPFGRVPPYKARKDAAQLSSALLSEVYQRRLPDRLAALA